MTIASDSVDDEMVQKPRRWDVAFIRKFMLAFGILSSVFDYCTFGALLFLLGGTQAQFRTGWFVESVISAAAVVLVIRTRKPFYRSKPGAWLMIATFAVAVLTLVLPLTPLAAVFGFQPLPARFLLVVGLIVLLYIAAAEVVKRRFYSRVEG
jgi:Mg2+-importing ATPase